jgi:hypothetical protein
MTSTSIAGQSVTLAGAARIGLVAIGLLLAASAVYVIAVPVDPEYIHTTTGITWDAFMVANPEIAAYMEREARLLGVGYLGLGLLTAALAWRLPSSGRARETASLWIVPLTLGAATAALLPAGFSVVVLTYGVLAVLAAVAVAGLFSRRAGV